MVALGTFMALVSRVAAPVMAGAIRRANRKDLERLKRILESGPW